MISPMTKYSFILLNGEQEGLLEKLQEIGLVDITRSVKPVDGPSGELLRAVEQRKDLVQSLGKIDFPETLRPAPVEGDLTTRNCSRSSPTPASRSSSTSAPPSPSIPNGPGRTRSTS